MRVGVAYLAVSWVVLQIVDVVAPILEFSSWVPKAVLLALAVGLLAVLVLSWIFELTPDGLKKDSEVDRSQTGSSVTSRWASRLTIVFLSIAVALLLLDRFRSGAGPAIKEMGSGSVSVVVLPLDNLMNNEDQAYFVQGMHDALITALTKVDALNVVSRTSSLRYRDSSLSLPEIARELDVDMVVEGSVLHAGNQVRITTQLVNAHNDQHLWAESFDRELTDILALYSDVAQEIAHRVEVEVTPEDRLRLGGAGQVDPEAYKLYLKARYLLDTWSPAEMLEGIDMMREAVAMAPDSALFQAGLATGLQYLAWFDFVEPVAVLAEARQSALRAIELDADLSDSWVAMGSVNYYLEFNIELAAQAFRRALALHPGNQQALIHFAWLLGEAGQFDQAITYAERSIELDPFSAVAHGGLGQTHYLARDFETSRAVYQTVLELDRGDPSAYYFLAWPTMQLGEAERAIELGRKAVELSGGAPMYQAGLAYNLAAAGYEQQAREILENLSAMGVSPMYLAEIHLGLGELEPALTFLEAAFEARSGLIPYINKGPRFDPLRGEPRFQALIERMGWSSGIFQ